VLILQKHGKEVARHPLVLRAGDVDARCPAVQVKLSCRSRCRVKRHCSAQCSTNQALIPDSAANAFGAVVSDAAMGRIGD